FLPWWLIDEVKDTSVSVCPPVDLPGSFTGSSWWLMSEVRTTEVSPVCLHVDLHWFTSSSPDDE
ncbi:hypothetical protein JOB18_024479, partial [Solea senegalensis]